MKKLLIAVIGAWSTVCWAQDGTAFTQRVWCFDQRIVAEVLSSEYKETAIFHGDADSIQYVLYANEKTGGWTMIAYQNGMGCIVGAGKKHRQIYGPKI